MSAIKICRICLRTDYQLRLLDESTLKFYRELCNDSNDNTKHFFCSICEHLLKKSCNFKNKCYKSNEIFQRWRKCTQNKPPLSELHEYIPPSPYNLNTKQFTVNKCKEIHFTETAHFADVKIKDETNDLDDLTGDAKINFKINKEFADWENDYYNNNSDFSDDDKCLLEYTKENKRKNEDEICLFDSKESKKKEKGVKTKKSKQKSLKIKKEDPELILEELLLKKKKRGRPVKTPSVPPEPKVKKKMGRPLKDHKEYESVFDITLFPNDAAVREEFALRKYSEHYLAAKHKCHVCFTSYKCEKLLQFHMKWHDPSAGDFPCDVCAMRFKSKLSMRKHKTNVHFGRFQCRKCPLITYHKMVMILHYRKHQGVSYVCKHCKRTYNHSSTYLSHLRKSHPSEHVCVTCAQTFVSEKGLAVHRKKVHDLSSKYDADATIRCEPCDLTFTTQHIYNVHVLNTTKHKHIADTLIACPECGEEFPDKLQVRAHRRQAHPQYNFSAMKRAEGGMGRGHKCPLCGLSGTFNTWLYRHFQAAHPTECYELCVRSDRRKHLCDQCGKSFYNITQLTEHVNVHTGLKPFRCDKCPAAFRSKTHLKFHVERHAPPSRECAHCGKKFVSAANLSNHMRSHIGDRRYKCTYCAKGFLHCAALREHVRGVHLHIRRPRKTQPDHSYQHAV